MNINKFLFEELLPSKHPHKHEEAILPKQETIVPDLKIEDITPVVEVPVEKHITEQELELAKTNAFTEAYQKATLEYEQKKSLHEEQVTEVLEKINIQLAVVTSDQNKLLEEVKSDLFAVATKIFSKINAQITTDTSDLITQMIDKYVGLISDELSVSIVLHPQTKILIGDKIKDILVKSRVEHKFIIKESDSIEQSDCVIEWDNGSIEFNKNKLLDKIVNKL
jgi:flagellar biosynthesis/type III secretory pathway protein FliH